MDSSLGGPEAVASSAATWASARVLALAGVPGERAEGAQQQAEHDGRHARQHRDHAHHRRRHAQRLGIEGQLRHQCLVGGAFDTGLGHHQAGGGGDDKRRHLRDQAVTDRQQGEGLGGVAEAHALLRHRDDDAADDIDADDEQAGNGIAAHEFAGAVHGAEEIGFRFDRLAAMLGFLFIDQAGGEIGVDRHLLAGHGVQIEARRDFGDAARTFGDDDEVHDDEDREHDDADDEIALHDELAEGLG